MKQQENGVRTPTSTEPEAWLKRLDELNGMLPGDTYARLANVGLRISRLPAAMVMESLHPWLDREVHRVMNKPRSDGEVTGHQNSEIEPRKDPLWVIEDHVDHVTFVYRYFRPVFAAAWLLGALIWILIILAVWQRSDLSTIDSNATTLFRIPASIWLGVFIAGLSGSMINVLGRVYTPHFQVPSVYLIPNSKLTDRGNDEDPSKLSNRADNEKDKDKKFKFDPLLWLSTLIYQLFLKNLLMRVFIESLLRAISRLLLGGLFAVGVFLVLASGLIIGPLVEGFVGNDGAIDFTRNKAVLFFLSISFIAGFSDELAYALMGRAINAVSASRDQN